MHDLINDLAKSIDPCSYFSSDENKGGSTLHEDKVRHAAMVIKSRERCLSKRFDVFRSMKKLRTFMPFQISDFAGPIVSVFEEVIKDLIVDMKRLKILSLRYFQITQVPGRIGELKLLRSIDFSHTEIEILPESICDLVELQSLVLRRCRRLQKLPSNIHRLVNLLYLDITGTNNLQVMPLLIGELTNLEILSDFVVGKEVGQELNQLGPLGCIQRELHVRNLQYVHDVEDARLANLFVKEAILELCLDWDLGCEISREDDHQFNLLHHLQPPKKIESLAVDGYEAKIFPSWFNNQGCMENILSITLTDCRNVDSLPPVGQLPLLERLEMCGLEGISCIGPEFYGSKGPYFQSLKKLSFKNMGAWEKWLSNRGDENDQPFPSLRHLIMMNCPKLRGGCALSLPSLVDIYISGCDGGYFTCLAVLTSMTNMEITEIPELVHFEGCLSTSWVALKEMKIVKCPQFKSFVEGDGGKQVPPNLRVLEIEYCGELDKLSEDLSKLTSLSEMSVGDCMKLCSFPSGGLPLSLRRLKLEVCPCLPQSRLISIRLLDYLEELTLRNLNGLVLITELISIGSPLSRSLRKLNIENCGSLTTLTDSLEHLSSLSDLTLWELPELEMEIFPSLPCNLSSFRIITCPKVKSLPHDMGCLTSLKLLFICDCEGITSLSSRGGLPPNLEELDISRCKNLNQPLEEWGLRGLAALRVLGIYGEMECVDEMECFPPTNVDGDLSRLLPSSLLLLSIGGMQELERVGRGLRHHLTSLQSLFITDCERLRCLPDDGFPDSLKRLRIQECLELERVGGGLRHHLTSLQSLYIINCERLMCLPDDGLLDSLESVRIWGCTEEELREKCRKGKGEYWHSHLRLIPEVDIGDE